VSIDQRVKALEASVSRVVDDDPEACCLRCLGHGGYRRLNDRLRERLAAGVEREPVLTCRGCGGPSFHGALVAERAALGLA
jgi:hypothetical protein